MKNNTAPSNRSVFDRLGLAFRAGKLATGDESVMKSVRSGAAKLVIVAEDASDNAAKKYQDKCSFYHIPIIQFGSRADLGASIGKEQRVALAVLDAGFAGLIRKSLQIPSEVKDIE
jgi:ribosomal protein L7Ae-like RNA K-turn-binding protein